MSTYAIDPQHYRVFKNQQWSWALRQEKAQEHCWECSTTKTKFLLLRNNVLSWWQRQSIATQTMISVHRETKGCGHTRRKRLIIKGDGKQQQRTVVTRVEPDFTGREMSQGKAVSGQRKRQKRLWGWSCVWAQFMPSKKRQYKLPRSSALRLTSTKWE